MSSTRMGSAPADYRVKVGVRNNRILHWMRVRGVVSVPAFCKDHGLNYSGVNSLICLRDPARRADGSWRKLPLDLALFLGVDPEDLFTDRQAEGGLMSVEREITEEAIVSLTVPDSELIEESPENGLLQKVDGERFLPRLLGALNDRQRRILLGRYGVGTGDERTLDDVSREEGIGRERVRQIEMQAVKKLRREARRLEMKASLRRMQQ